MCRYFIINKKNLLGLADWLASIFDIFKKYHNLLCQNINLYFFLAHCGKQSEWLERLDWDEEIWVLVLAVSLWINWAFLGLSFLFCKIGKIAAIPSSEIHGERKEKVIPLCLICFMDNWFCTILYFLFCLQWFLRELRNYIRISRGSLCNLKTKKCSFSSLCFVLSSNI